MPKLNFVQNGALEEIRFYSNKFNLPLINNLLKFPKSSNNGYIYGEQVEDNGLGYMFTDLVTNDTVELTREKNQVENGLTIFLFVLGNNQRSEIICGEDRYVFDEKTEPVAFFISSKFSVTITHMANTRLQGVVISISEKWLKSNFSPLVYKNSIHPLMEKGITLRTLNQQKINTFNSLFTVDFNLPFCNVFIRKNIYEIIYLILKQLNTPEKKSQSEHISKTDLESLYVVRNFLEENIMNDFLGVPGLAKKAFMSESKLKKLYKNLFGYTLYDHYLHFRMQKAKQLLENNEMNISQIGRLYKYKNLSNFTNAFKKEFGFLPSDVKQSLLK